MADEETDSVDDSTYTANGTDADNASCTEKCTAKGSGTVTSFNCETIADDCYKFEMCYCICTLLKQWV